MAYIEMVHSFKRYHMGDITITANNDVSFGIERDELAIILGPSGAGKSTVLNILGGMDTNSEGKVIIDGVDISDFNAKQLTDYRRNNIGFVFQFYNLVANLTAKENVELASELVKNAADFRRRAAARGHRESRGEEPEDPAMRRTDRRARLPYRQAGAPHPAGHEPQTRGDGGDRDAQLRDRPHRGQGDPYARRPRQINRNQRASDGHRGAGMVKRMLWKDIRQTLSKSKGRVVSIVCLMALGSFALVGLKVTGPDMQATAAGFYGRNNLADITVVSNYGISKDDERIIGKADGIKEVEYGYFKDVVISGTDRSMRIYSKPDAVSTYDVTEDDCRSGPAKSRWT